MDFVTLISNAFGAIKEFFGFQSKRLDLKNSTEMKDAATEQKAQDKKDEINKAIKDENVNEIQKGLS